MSFDGSGHFSRLYSWVVDAANGVKISSTRTDAEDNGFATGLSNCICRDGQSTVSADIPWNTKKITGLGNATTGTDALNQTSGDARYPTVSGAVATWPSVTYSASFTFTANTSVTFPASGTLATTTATTAVSENVTSLVDGASITLNAAVGNIFYVVAGGNRTIIAPQNAITGQKIIIRHKASGADRTLALATSAGGFRFGTDIPSITATTSAKTDYIGAIYNAQDTIWDIVAVTKGFT